MCNYCLMKYSHLLRSWVLDLNQQSTIQISRGRCVNLYMLLFSNIITEINELFSDHIYWREPVQDIKVITGQVAWFSKVFTTPEFGLLLCHSQSGPTCADEACINSIN